jgi:hypothetical protein
MVREEERKGMDVQGSIFYHFGSMEGHPIGTFVQAAKWGPSGSRGSLFSYFCFFSFRYDRIAFWIHLAA